MKRTNHKFKYQSPQIIKIQIDNNISLALMSGESNPGEPYSINMQPYDCKNIPFKDHLS